MHLMRYGRTNDTDEDGWPEDWTDDHDTAIVHTERDSTTNITTVYCTNGWYFTLTADDVTKINNAQEVD